MYYRRFRGRAFLTSTLLIAALLLTLRLLFGQVLPRPVSEVLEVDKPLPCSQLPGANETLVVLKTGATELQDKLPVHFHTTLKCYPNYAIFSDYGETFQGHEIIDALEWVNPEIKDSNADFELWRRLQKEGRAALAPDELSGPESKVSANTGKPKNPGWKLDKWKFLPMVNKTLNAYPDMKWYAFVETDTYFFWTTTMAWLAELDHTKPYYIGAQMQIGEVVFGHGGCGFIASKAALRMVVDLFVKEQTEWEKFTNGHWAGDCVLGKAFKDAGAPLNWAWPTIQIVKPGGLDYTKFDYNKRLWCYPTISYHHLSPPEVEDVWRFEQEWLLNTTRPLKHSDVFKSYILPNIAATKGTKTKWDNLNGKWEEAPLAESFEACRARCMDDAECVQYAFSANKCTTSSLPRWGESNAEAQSGWLIDRVHKWLDNMEPCNGDEGWP